MDTRFWGPSGWKLIHLAAAAYNPIRKGHMRRWLASLPYVLPCKFCRASLMTYYEELPYEPALSSAKELLRWTYKIHGKVNDKLRGQGQTIPCDPTFREVQTYYMSWLQADQSCSRFPVWDFLFSVAYQHPRSTHGSTPMPDAPPHPPPRCSIKDKCRWNFISAEERMPAFRTFWQELINILPTSQLQTRWRQALNEYPIGKALETRRATVLWVWHMHKATDVVQQAFPAVCRRLMSHSSNCSKSKRARTCRRLRQRQRTTHKKRGI